MKNFKPSLGFESKRESYVSYGAMGVVAALVLASLASFAAMAPSIKGSVVAMRELSSTYRPQGELVSTRTVTLTLPQMQDIAARMVEPGVSFSVLDGQQGQKLGIEVFTKNLGTMQEVKAWRHGVDSVMLAMPGWQWDALKLCAGVGCDKGSAAYVLLTATRVELGAGQVNAPTAAIAPTVAVPIALPPPKVQLD